MGKLRRRQENGGAGRRPGDEWSGKVLPPAVSARAAPGGEGWGPQSGPPSSPALHPLGAGRRRGAQKPPGSGFLRATPPGPSPTAVGSAARGAAGTVASPGPAVAWGWSSSPAQPTLLCPVPFPARRFGDLGEWSAGTGRAKEREKRSAPCRFCKIAVTTFYPECGRGRGRIGP